MDNRVRYTRQNIISNSFYQLPKFLFDAEFNKLSNDARVLYALLRNRHEISIRNEWYDENGEVYLYFKREDMQSILHLSGKTVTKAMKDLKDFRLLEEVRQGISKPNKIYLLSAIIAYSDIENAGNLENPLKRNIYGSRSVNFTGQETEILRPNQNKEIHNNISHVQSCHTKDGQDKDRTTVQAYETIIKSNIGYDTFLNPQDKALIDEIIAVMMDAITTKGEHIRIGGESKSRQLVRSQLLKLQSEHITHVIDSYRSLETPVTKKKQYLLTMLYNASMELGAEKY